MTVKLVSGQILGFATPTTGDSSTPPTVVVGNGGTTNTIGLAVRDDLGNAVADARRITVSGADVASDGTDGAVLRVRQVTVLPNVVLTGGTWVSRDLSTSSYLITVAGGTGLIGGKSVRWEQTTVTIPGANAVIACSPQGVVTARAVGAPELLPPTSELALLRAYVDVGIYGARVYAVADVRTFAAVTPRSPLYLRERVEGSKITSGAWAGATAVNEIGDINWYFANLGLYPFVEELPTQVQDHLDIQIAKFYGASGTANASPTWNSLHGTTWSAYYKWPYDVKTPRGTPTLARADSHDSYATTFLRLAVRYARVASGGLAWWDANISAIQDCLYYNVLVRQRFVGAGYLNETFQDPAVYPFCQTMDNIEVWRGVTDALALMTDRGGSQATWAATYAGTPTNILAGVRAMWQTTANTAGETGWMSYAWDNGAAAPLTNELNRFYPDLAIGLTAAANRLTLDATPSIARDKMTATLAQLDAKAPNWWKSRQFDLYPWGLLAAGAANLGLRETALEWLTFVQRHCANDSPGYLLIHDLGWARYVERVLAGETL